MCPRQTIEHSETGVHAAGATLPGDLAMPPHATGAVVFAHGSGSSRFSRRNRFVAEQLNEAGLATLLFDLLTAEENAVDEQTRELRFDIPLLANRLTGAVLVGDLSLRADAENAIQKGVDAEDWLKRHPAP